MIVFRNIRSMAAPPLMAPPLPAKTASASSRPSPAKSPSSTNSAYLAIRPVIAARPEPSTSCSSLMCAPAATVSIAVRSAAHAVDRRTPEGTAYRDPRHRCSAAATEGLTALRGGRRVAVVRRFDGGAVLRHSRGHGGVVAGSMGRQGPRPVAACPAGCVPAPGGGRPRLPRERSAGLVAGRQVRAVLVDRLLRCDARVVLGLGCAVRPAGAAAQAVAAARALASRRLLRPS